MFKLNKPKVDESGEKINFKFSNFRVLLVPKGWEKLCVSLLSVETGKTLVKSSKTAVRNGCCQWTDVLSEAIWVTQDDASKELEHCQLKFIVSMGSAKSGILGEAVVNLTDYTNSKASIPLSLSLKKCNSGTTLHVEIQCLSPRTKLREEIHADEMITKGEDTSMDFDDIDNKSDGSDFRSVGSSSSSTIGGRYGVSNTGENGSKDMSLSASESRHSSDSVGTDNLMGRQDSASSQSSSVGAGPGDDTVEKIRGEAKMWERNSLKLKHDLETLRRDFSEQSQRHAEDMDQVRKDLEDEIKFQKESNANLAKQLAKTQESNIELVSLLQELENTIEKQRLEIEKISAEREELSYSRSDGPVDSGQISDGMKVENLVKEIEVLRFKVQELERDCNELTEENLNLIFKLKGTKDDDQTDVLGEEAVAEKLDRHSAHLQTMCTNLELELESSKDKVSDLDAELSKTRLDLEKKELKVTELQTQLESYHVKETDWLNQITVASTSIENLKMQLHSKHADDDEQMSTIRSDLEECKALLSSKNQEAEWLKNVQMELEAQVSILQKEKAQYLDEIKGLQESKKSLQTDLRDCHDKIESLKAEQQELEVKYEMSDHQRQKLEEEIASLRSQVQSMVKIHDEVLELKHLLENANYEKRIVEEELKQRKEEKCLNDKNLPDSSNCSDNLALGHVTQNDFVKSGNQHHGRESLTSAKINQGDCQLDEGRSQILESDLVSKIQLLETELAEALESNNMYKMQLKSYLATSNQSKLEEELNDMRVRYSHLSLRFAQVESEREELVLRLKAIGGGNGRRWFSFS